MGRPKNPRRVVGRPNFLNPLILLWLVKMKRGKPGGFPHHWTNGTPNNGLPKKLTFTRQGIYYGFKRLEKNRLIVRTNERPSTFKPTDSRVALSEAYEFWKRVHPPIKVTAEKFMHTHENLLKSLRRLEKRYNKLPAPLRKKFSGFFKEENIEGVNITLPHILLTQEQANRLSKEVKRLSDEYWFIENEKKLKVLPYKTRPKGIRDLRLLNIPTLTIQAEGLRENVVSFATIQIPENLVCPDCKDTCLFHEGEFVCPQCGSVFSSGIL